MDESSVLAHVATRGCYQGTEQNNGKKNTNIDSEMYNIIYSLKAIAERNIVLVFHFDFFIFDSKATHRALNLLAFALIFIYNIWCVCVCVCVYMDMSI